MIEFSRDELIRYSRQLKLAEIGVSGQQKLRAAKVLCIGAGGLGAPLLFYLASSGVGHIGIVDHDEISLDNLQRQILYQTEFVGEKKCEVAKKQLLALNPNIEIETYSEKLEASNATPIIMQYDIIADCTDNFATRYLINDVCSRLQKPYVFASVAKYQGQCSLFLGNKTGCYRCLFPEMPDQGMIQNCNEMGVLGVIPGLLGLIQATEILKWILRLGTSLAGRLIIVNMLDMQFNEIELQRNPECYQCHFAPSWLVNRQG